MEIPKEKNIGVNDALVCFFMEKHWLSEIYSFDRNFYQFEGVVRLMSVPPGYHLK